MLGNLIRHKSIVRLAASALIAICLIHLPARAYPGAIAAAQDTHIDLYKNIWINPGLARGQTLRYTWANLNDPDPQKREFETFSIRVRLLARGGNVIAEIEAATVEVGEFQSFDFNRDQINLTGEEPTGRLQTLLEATVIGRTRHRNLILKQGILETFDDAVEIIDNAGARTTVSLGGGVNGVILNDSRGTEHLNPNAFQIVSAGKDYLVGIAPQQTLRVSARNPSQPASGEDPEKLKMKFAVKLLDADDRVIAQTDEITLEPGQFQFFDFKRSDLPLSGEPGGRLQVRAQVIFRKLQLRAEFPSSVELVDENTGRTTAMFSHKPKEIVVVGSR